MEVDRNFRSWQEGLRAARRQWVASDKDDGALLRGATLGQAEDCLAERESELSEVEIEYIQASVALRECKAKERQVQRQR
jgi:hypothetical protein